MERAGIATITIGNLRGAMRKVKTPRGIATPFPRGETLGPPGATLTHQRVLACAFAHLQRCETPGEILRFPEDCGDETPPSF